MKTKIYFNSLISLILLVFSVNASAGLIFSDNFESDTVAGGVTGSLVNWNITSGNLDVVGLGFAASLCNNATAGHCIDLDGTNSNATIVTKLSYSLSAGTYLFEFDYGNNTTQDNSLFYSIDNINSNLGSLLSGSVSTMFIMDNIYSHFTANFVVSSATNINIIFRGAGTANSYGSVLDNVSLRSVQTTNVPEPATMTLIMLGLLFIVSRRRLSQ
ncbi:MAG: hypothetical protein COB35_12625 [Gammaproteobacteria bacterium]|nr:MAG: hypothetical protein COB35_12625 [Gammaproteobacteria bacterium]